MLGWLKNVVAKDKVTTGAGAAVIVTGVIQVLYSFDTDPSTTTDWSVVGLSLAAALGLLKAADSKLETE